MERFKEMGGRAAVLGSAVTGTLLMGFIMAGPASATPADPVEAAFSDMSAKIVTYGALVVGLVVLAVGIFLGIKWLRKGVSAA